MAITVGTSTATTGNLTTGFTLVINAGVVAGDILLLGITNRDGTADPTVVDNDTGGNTWAKVANQNANTNGAVTVWWKRATSATASKTITVSGCTGSAAGTVTPYTGALAAGTPYGTPVTEANASANELQAGITTTVAGSYVCLFVGCTSNDTLNPTTYTATDPTTLSERAEGVSAGGSDCSLSHASAARATAGATGNLAWAQTDGTGASIAFELIAQINTDGVLASTVDPVTSSSTGTVDVAGSSDRTIDPVTSSSTGTVDVFGVSDRTIDPVTAGGTGTVDVFGVADSTIAPVASDATGINEDLGNLDKAVGDVSIAAAGEVTTGGNAGELEQTIDAIASSGSGTVDVAGAVDAAIAAVTTGGTGTVDVAGAMDATITPVTIGGAGTVDVAGAADTTFAPVTLGAAGAVDVTGNVDASIGLTSVHAEGQAVSSVLGTLDVTLTPVSAHSSAQVTDMPLTTAISLRDRLITMIEDIVPSSHASSRFHKHSAGEELQPWAERNPQAAFRRFLLRHGLGSFTDVHTAVYASETVIMELVIAYPHQRIVSARARDDLMRADRHQIERVIGMAGVAAFADAKWRRGMSTRVIGAGVDFMRLRETFAFYRSAS